MNNCFCHYVEDDSFHLKYAKGKPGVEGKEFHDYHEMVLFLEGSSLFISENIQQSLKPKMLVLIPKENFHQFCVTDKVNYTRCILAFKDTEELKPFVKSVFNITKIIPNPSKQILSIFENIFDVCESELDQSKKILYVKPTVIQLLLSLETFSQNYINKNINISPYIQKALTYIDKNLSNELTIRTIADNIYVSPSFLAHKFRDELNISIHRYVTEKRFSTMRKLLNKGESLSTAAKNCGFNDYSNFYRAYKKYYGEKPSKIIKKNKT